MRDEGWQISIFLGDWVSFCFKEFVDLGLYRNKLTSKIWKKRYLCGVKPHLSIGQSDFNVIRTRGDYYVDKSLFIQEIMDGPDIVLVTRPRRFGKTLNMSMLRYFYGNDADYTGTFQGLAIMEAGQNYLDKMGKHPILFMSFKDIKDTHWRDAYASLKDEIWVAPPMGFIKQYEAVRSQLDSREVGVMDRYVVGKSERRDYKTLLKTLCHTLYLYHGAKPLVLIDEYDTPLISAWLEQYYQSCVNFLRDFLSGLKDNPWLEKAVLTGVVRVSKESLFSGLNNLGVWSVLHDRAADKFGFTEPEVAKLLQACGLNGREMDNVRSWYNGYTFGGVEVYNPWSILCYAYTPQDGFRTYWANTSDNRLLRKLFFEGEGSVREDVDALLRGEWISKIVNEHLVFQDLGQKRDAVWNLLLAAGYLKRRGIEPNDATITYDCEVAIPNKEVLYVYAESIRDWVNEAGLPSDRFTDMVNYLANGELDKFRIMLRQFLERVASVYDTARPNTENFYHALFLGMLAHFNHRFVLKSNRESGLGRYDIALLPRKAGERGIVLEIKMPQVEDGETLETALDDALKQVRDRHYEAELKAHGAGEVLLVGIAVLGKQFLIKKA